jgi:hypothetical protein
MQDRCTAPRTLPNQTTGLPSYACSQIGHAAELWAGSNNSNNSSSSSSSSSSH